MGIGWQEILLILLVVLLLFGAKRIPEIAKGLGKGISEFKKAARDAKDEIEAETKEPEKKDKDQKLQG
jgi:sec-independent protein translocase protein TatA